jgi:predicted transcriptional regulator of viral defense system
MAKKTYTIYGRRPNSPANIATFFEGLSQKNNLKKLRHIQIFAVTLREVISAVMANGFVIPNRQDDAGYRSILQSVKDGELIKVRNGVYATVDNLAAGMIDIDAIVPNGILCLYSAWHYYGMTTQIPDAYYVAIERKRKIRLPEIIDINLVYQNEALLNIGRTTANIEGIEVAIYDKERCLCDAIKYRNKIGIDVMSEILNSYLDDANRNLNRLSEYAKRLRVFNLLSNYLNVKL